MQHAYISCPMTVPKSDLDETIKLVQSYGVMAHWWSKGTDYDEKYYKEVIEDCNAFIVILPGMAWSCKADKMTSGSRKETTLAISAEIPIYIAYRNRTEGLGIYAADVKMALDRPIIQEISGVPSTRYNFIEDFGDTNLAASSIKLGIEGKTKQQLVEEGFALHYSTQDTVIKQTASFEYDKRLLLFL